MKFSNLHKIDHRPAVAVVESKWRWTTVLGQVLGCRVQKIRWPLSRRALITWWPFCSTPYVLFLSNSKVNKNAKHKDTVKYRYFNIIIQLFLFFYLPTYLDYDSLHQTDQSIISGSITVPTAGLLFYLFGFSCFDYVEKKQILLFSWI